MNLEKCTLCPRACGANRRNGVGFCGGGELPRIARAALHFGEEPCISGTKGSGTVFFSGCALRCRFCQNGVISKEFFGEEVSIERLSEIFLELQDQGAETLNLVTPSHYAPWVADALKRVRDVLSIPVVCNCGGYESLEILHCFEGLVDVYMPDLKYFSSEKANRYSDAADYFSVAALSLREMFRQVGECLFSDTGILTKGVLIRHLVLPGNKSDSLQLLKWISETFPTDKIRLSLMRQYTPCGDLEDCPELQRSLFSLEYDAVLKEAIRLNLIGYFQGSGCDTLEMTPAFDLTGVRKENL